MRLSTSLPAILALLLLSSPAFLSVATAQPSQGNWVVTGQEVVENRTIALKGNLTVESGGNLTLEDVSLTMNLQYNGEYGILVQPGGSLYVYDSAIVSANLSLRYTFVAEGTNFVLKNSRVQGVGWCTQENEDACIFPTNPDPQHHEVGTIVETSGALIENDSISHSGFGLTVLGSNDIISGNLFGSNDLRSLVVINGVDQQILNNTFLQPENPFDSAVVVLENSNQSTVSGNKITCQLPLPNPYGGRCDGIKPEQSNDNVITDNLVQAANIAVFLSYSGGNRIVGNSMSVGEDGIYNFLNAVDTTIENNNITCTGCNAGVSLDYGDSSVIQNNSIAGSMTMGIQLDHSAHDFVSGNRISMDSAGIPGVYLSASDENRIEGNSISGAEIGLLVYSSSNNNTIYDNNVGDAHSISIDNSSSNLVYGNDFHDFPGEFGGPSDYGRNQWQNGTVGNYWSYYTKSQSCQFNSASSCFAGDNPYHRSAVPPSGSEGVSESSPFTVNSFAVQIPSPVQFPRPSSYSALNQPTIQNEELEVDYGTMHSNINGQCQDMTIENSTLFLGKSGPVTIDDYCSGSPRSLTIVNSRLIDEGFGFMIQTELSSLTIINSTLDGGYLQDFHVGNVTIHDSVIENSQEGLGITFATAYDVEIVGNQFSNDLYAIRGGNSLYAAGRVVIANNTIRSSVASSITWWGNASAVEISNNTLLIFTTTRVSGGGPSKSGLGLHRCERRKALPNPHLQTQNISNVASEPQGES